MRRAPTPADPPLAINVRLVDGNFTGTAISGYSMGVVAVGGRWVFDGGQLHPASPTGAVDRMATSPRGRFAGDWYLTYCGGNKRPSMGMVTLRRPKSAVVDSAGA